LAFLHSGSSLALRGLGRVGGSLSVLALLHFGRSVPLHRPARAGSGMAHFLDRPLSSLASRPSTDLPYFFALLAPSSPTCSPDLPYGV